MDPFSEEYLILKNKVQNQINNLEAQLTQNNSTTRTNHLCEFHSCYIHANKSRYHGRRQSDSIKDNFMLLIQNQRQLTRKLNGLADHVYSLASRKKKQSVLSQIHNNPKHQNLNPLSFKKTHHVSKSLCNKSVKIYMEEEDQSSQNIKKNLPTDDYYGRPCPIHHQKQYYTLKKKQYKNKSQPKNIQKEGYNHSKTKKKQLQRSVKNFAGIYGCK